VGRVPQAGGGQEVDIRDEPRGRPAGGPEGSPPALAGRDSALAAPRDTEYLVESGLPSHSYYVEMVRHRSAHGGAGNDQALQRPIVNPIVGESESDPMSSRPRGSGGLRGRRGGVEWSPHGTCARGSSGGREGSRGWTHKRMCSKRGLKRRPHVAIFAPDVNWGDSKHLNDSEDLHSFAETWSRACCFEPSRSRDQLSGGSH